MPSRGRFQSFLFSRISQQSLRLRDRLGRWMRQGQVAVTWGAQAALYPIFVGLQSLRLASRQLMPGRAMPAERPPLLQRWLQRLVGQAPPFTPSPESLLSSSPVLSTLDLLDAWANRGDLHLMAADKATEGVARLGAIAPVPVLTIRGIASCLDSRLLVLITPENQRLQGLSGSQQAQLQSCITEALAQAGYDRPSPDPSLEAASPRAGLPPAAGRLLLPLRQFYSQLAQRQQGAGAIATSLFRRAALGLYFGDVDKPQDDPQRPVAGAIAPAPNPIRALLTAYRRRAGSLARRSEAAITAPPPASSPALSPIPPSLSDGTGQDSLWPRGLGYSGLWQDGNGQEIDTTAEFLGYARHPLEQLLHWLDRGMLWLEERWAAFWQWWQERRSAPERPDS